MVRDQLLLMGVGFLLLAEGNFALAREGGRVELSGISLVPPRGWTSTAPEGACRPPREGPAGSDRVSPLGSWEVALPGRPRTYLSLCASDRPARVSFSGLERGVRTLESEVASSPGVDQFRVRNVRLARVDGLPAYRVRSFLASSGEILEQLQYVVAGSRTFVLSFGCPPSEYADCEAEFEQVIRSVEVEERPSALLGAAGWLWGGLLTALVAAGISARKNLRLFLPPA